MAFQRQPHSSSQSARRPLTLDLARALAPRPEQAEKIAVSFGLDPVDYDGIRNETARAVQVMADGFARALNEKATAMHFQRLVQALVGSAVGAGEFYSQKVSEARDLTSRLANDHRDEDRDGPAGFESKAERARSFAAQMALQAFAQLAAADGGVKAYLEVTGEAWKPYVAAADNTQSVSRRTATEEMAAFG